MAGEKEHFVLGLDLDGVCADFYGYMRGIAAEWLGRPIEELSPDVTYGFKEWGLETPRDYERLHHVAVTQRELFAKMPPLEHAPQAIRLLSAEGVRVRVITHRLFIRWFHEVAVSQTVRWLDHHGVPYWDLCLMADKEKVEADVYVEDSPRNIKRLLDDKRHVIAYTNSTNVHMDMPEGQRAVDWREAEALIRARYYAWREERGLALPPAPGQPPPDVVEKSTAAESPPLPDPG
jgi:hypothetical protein